MANRIRRMRTSLRQVLEKLGSLLNWEHITNQVGNLFRKFRNAVWSYPHNQLRCWAPKTAGWYVLLHWSNPWSSRLLAEGISYIHDRWWTYKVKHIPESKKNRSFLLAFIAFLFCFFVLRVFIDESRIYANTWLF